MSTRGKLVLLVGTTGSGKGALLGSARDLRPELVFPISCTTRSARPGELPGENYYFITEEEFDAHIQRDDFLEWAPYGGRRYGTLKSEILPALADGKIAIREVEVQGARMIRDRLPADSLAIIYVHAGSWEQLERRIRARAPITEEEVLARRTRYEDERSFMQEADVVVENPDGGLEEAKARFLEIIDGYASASAASRASS